ncbi:MAG: type VI secretion system baseplate subunit TssK [Nitrosomonas sp.]|nr:type VI secretion system baseplate subunit TssK [Nitrosomonas sp.]
MTWYNKVVWSEGMFLQPQHLQQHDRHVEKLLENRIKPLFGYFWGFSHIELNSATLSEGKIQLNSASGVFPDGTPFDFPQIDSPPIALEIDPEDREELIVLALPIRRTGSKEVNLNDNQNDNLARYAIEEAETIDSTAQAIQNATLQIGKLQLKLMRKSDLTDPYTTLGIAHITERRADNQLVLNKEYIPPILQVSANTVLSEYLSEINGLLHQRGEAIAPHMDRPGRGGVAEIADFLLLQTINRYEPLFKHYAEHSLLHPERLYSTCLNLSGELSTFSKKSRRPTVFETYQHDALYQCFKQLIDDLRDSLNMVIEKNAIPIQLQERQYGIRVAIVEDISLFKTASFVLAVNAQQSAETVRLNFPTQTRIGTGENIRDLVNLALPGIPLNALPVAPRQIPFHAGFNYFELDKGNDIWKQLERTGGLAIHIAGNFPGLELELWAIKN